MKFEDCRFKGKQRVRKNHILEITERLTPLLEGFGFQETSIRRYLEILVDQQEYNVRTDVFYDKITNRKLDYDFLAVIAYEYIMEHKSDFRN